MTVTVQCRALPAVQVRPAQPQIALCAHPFSPVRGHIGDVFERPLGVGGLIGPPPATLNLHDRLVGSNLSSALSGQGHALHPLFSMKSQTITSDITGTYRGPEGQPLAQVRLKDGNWAYVDPNTNRYFLTNEPPHPIGGGIVHTLPARDLPMGSRFSNSHFSNVDVSQLTRHANPFPFWLGGGLGLLGVVR